MGHKSTMCQSRRRDNMKRRDEHPRPQLGNNDNSKPNQTKPAAVTCYHCQGSGHYASSCPKRRSQEGTSGAGASNVKRVNLCVRSVPTGTMRIAGVPYSFHFDSGAECSLVKETVSQRLNGRRLNNTVTLIGLGQTPVYCTSQILTVVEIDNINLEILLHVLLDQYLQHNIVVGYEILLLGLTAHITASQLRFSKNQIVQLCHVSPTDQGINPDTVDTDVPPEYKDGICEIDDADRDDHDSNQ
ncbi:hypothetical protein HF086_000120 [Spodoptera exigua]|uniref:CCHC-type domain-containing protein n=1 Tax=Spodoptera exigua TaxID=7107 RepID=A0A922MQJ8_SPOEX|nr:hypothetical protein HF086_000120 [Spodoptera exigua]